MLLCKRHNKGEKICFTKNPIKANAAVDKTASRKSLTKVLTADSENALIKADSLKENHASAAMLSSIADPARLRPNPDPARLPNPYAYLSGAASVSTDFTANRISIVRINL